MSTITTLFEQAQLAEAAYSNFSNNTGGLVTTSDELITALTTGGSTFSTAQATAFANEWRVVDHIPDTASGFSATLFQNITTGAYSFAIRGSTQIFDFVADAALIAADGTAPAQVVDMYNYWQHLNAPAGAIYDAAVLVPLASFQVGQYTASQLIYDSFSGTYSTIKFVKSNTLSDTTLQTGSGALPVCPANLNVEGHSLGGHLAMAFERLFPSAGANTLAVNGLGFKLDNSNVNNLFSMLGGSASFTAAQIQNVYGIAGPEFASMNNGVLQQPSGWDGIYIEDGSLLSAQMGGHSISQMADSLALYNLFATLDPMLNTDPNGLLAITNILRAESNVAANSLESAISALGKLFNVPGTVFSSNEFDTSRDLLYKAVQDITAALPANGIPLTLRDLSAFNATQLASVAHGNIAYRYALVNGNPFALVGNDAVYAQHNNGELDLFDSATHTGTLTEQYLKDRSAFLVDKIIANAQDNLSNGMGYVDYAGTKQYFRDEGGATPATVVLGGSEVANLFITQPPNNIQQIRFGSGSVADTFQGGIKNDHLYGMGGNDTLQGNGGSDYLEGGQGADKYIWNNGDGFDIISDTDGFGSIAINGQTLTNGESSDGGHTYTGKDGSGTEHIYAVLAGDINAAAGATLLIDGAAKILNYRQGDLGIILNGAPAVQQSTTLITGDLVPIVYGTDSQGNPVYHYDALGNRIVDPGKPGAVDDILYGSSGGDQIISGAGSDFVNGNDGADLIEGGTGAGILAGGNGDDRLYAGSETGVADAIAAGNSQTGSGLKGDWLAGGAGDDAMIAGADDDVLSGGAGSDLLIAGAGNDYILGDADYVAQSFGWTVTPQAGIYDFQPAIGATDQAGSGSDIIYAGDGNDHAWAGGGADAVYGEGGNDILDGGDGNDFMDGDAGNDILQGGAGNDILYGDAGANYLDGGDVQGFLKGILFWRSECEAANDMYCHDTEQAERRAA